MTTEQYRSLRDDLESFFRRWGSYLDVGEAQDRFYVFIRHVSLPTYDAIAAAINQLRGSLISESHRDGDKRGTWSITKTRLAKQLAAFPAAGELINANEQWEIQA